MKVKETLHANFNDLVELRRHLHMYPELSFQEVNTPKLIAEKLRSFGIEVKEKVGGNGVVGLLRGAYDGPTIHYVQILMRFQFKMKKMFRINRKLMELVMLAVMIFIQPRFLA